METQLSYGSEAENTGCGGLPYGCSNSAMRICDMNTSANAGQASLASSEPTEGEWGRGLAILIGTKNIASEAAGFVAIKASLFGNWSEGRGHNVHVGAAGH